MTAVLVDETAEAADDHPPRLPFTVGASPVAVGILLATTLGFLCLHRFFAHLGAPALGVSTGEIVLAAAFVYTPTRNAMLSTLGWLFTPGRLHVVAWTAALFAGYVAFTTIRGYLAGYGFDALRHFSYGYYVLCLPLGIWIASVVPDFLRRFALWLAWANGIYAIAYIGFLDRLGIAAPLTDTPLIMGSASGVAIVGLLCTHRKPTSVWYLFALNGIGMMVAQARAEWLAVGAALAVWAVLEHRVRDLVIGFVAAVGFLLVLQLTAIDLPTASTRQGSVTVAGIAGRVIAPFDEDLAAALTPEYRDFAGTARWRTRWWKQIWEDVHKDDMRLIAGFGAGYPLASLTNFVDPEVVTPHNLVFYALGYGGWLGLILLAGFQASLGRALFESRRRTGNPLGPALWTYFLAINLFTVWYDSPIGAFPSFLLLGAALAPFPSAGTEDATSEGVDA